MVHKSGVARSPRRLSVFGIALAICLAFASVVAGSASAISVSPAPINSVFTSGSSLVYYQNANGSLQCDSITGNGTFSSGSAGTYNLLFNNCKSPLGGVCTTPGQAVGVIKTKPLTINIEYLNTEKSKFGIGFKPTAVNNIFAEFNCGYGVSWVGGIIGEITSPGLNSPSAKWTVEFAATSPTKAAYNFMLPTYEWLASGGKTGWFYNYALQEKLSSTTRPMTIVATNSMDFGGVPTTILP